MSTLLLRFGAPLQSWGSSSRFQWRETNREPTKSAMIGMLAAAEGRRRNDSIDDLLCIKFGVRLDQPGKFIRDFHTARTVDGKQAFVSHRRYLSDAVFLVGIEDEHDRLVGYQQALLHPMFPLFLGRRSCPPTQPLVLGIRENQDLLTALQSQPWLAADFYKNKHKQQQMVNLEIVIDVPYGTTGSYLQRDLPKTFNQTHRQYTSRSMLSNVEGVLVENPKAVTLSSVTDHDALLGLEEV